MKISKQLFILFASAALLAGCKDKPEMTVNGQPVYEVPFRQPLTLDPSKEQVFYFKFDDNKDQTNQVIGVTTWIPSQDRKLFALWDEWIKVHNDDTSGENALPFYFSLTYHKDGKSQRIEKIMANKPSSASILEIMRKENNKKWDIFVLGPYAGGASETIDGVEYILEDNRLVSFMPSFDGGYYEVVIKPVAGVDYHHVKMAIFVEQDRSSTK